MSDTCAQTLAGASSGAVQRQMSDLFSQVACHTQIETKRLNDGPQAEYDRPNDDSKAANVLKLSCLRDGQGKVAWRFIAFQRHPHFVHQRCQVAHECQRTEQGIVVQHLLQGQTGQNWLCCEQDKKAAAATAVKRGVATHLAMAW